MSSPVVSAPVVSAPLGQAVREQPATLSVRFLLDTDADPGMLPRLLQPFAKRDLIPDRMWSHRTPETLHVEIAMAAMPSDYVHLVEGNLRAVVGVRSVQRLVRPSLSQVA